KITARHALNVDHLRFLHQHGASTQRIGMFPQSLRILVHISRDEMVLNYLLEEIKPEKWELREHPAFFRDAGAQHVIKSGNSVCGNKQKLSVQRVQVAYLAAGVQIEIGKISLEENSI